VNKEQYLEMRNGLMADAEKFINDGKVEESNAKMKEIEALDNKWEETKKANANLNALKDNNKAINIENQSKQVKGEKVVAEINGVKEKDEKQMYVDAWAKNMMGKKLDDKEQVVFDKVNTEFNNAYTHDTGNSGVLIPTTVAAGIFKRAEEMYPLYADAKKFAVAGKLSLKKHTGIAAGDAKFYDEATPTEDEQNNFGELVLDGCELSKAVTVSWKLRTMAVSEFIPFIINELGERVGAALGASASVGKGSSVSPAEPEGVETALLAEASTPQVVTYDPDNATTPVPLTYDKVVQAIAKVHSSYLAGASIYATNATIWTQLATLKDDNGRPLFIPDVTSGGVGRMFGMVVKADAGVSDGNIIIGNAAQGLVFNTNEPASIVTEDHAKARTTDYVAYSIVDGGVLDTKAFALIENIPNA
jgi:HK97 family phage major capsid protein